MTLEAGKEMDRRCVLNWLYEVYVTPRGAFDEYTEGELKMFAHDAIVLLGEQQTIVRCKDCKHWDAKKNECHNINSYMQYKPCFRDWFCADGKVMKWK